MGNSNSTMAKKVAQAAIAFEKQRTGRVPKSVTAVMSNDTLVITLHAALSPAERALARTPEGAAQVQEFHQQLFNESSLTSCVCTRHDANSCSSSNAVRVGTAFAKLSLTSED